jgi:hypothetical protein
LAHDGLRKFLGGGRFQHSIIARRVDQTIA